MSDASKKNTTTVGILFPGEMGSALGRLLAAARVRVVTTLEGRSDRTRRLCRDAGLDVLDSLSDVVCASDVVISLVTPASVEPVARRFCEAIACSSGRPIFIDANSIAPHTAESIAKLVVRAGCRFVDATIHGLASRLASQGTLYLSGAAADEVAGLFQPVLKTRLLGAAPGRASAFKMLMAGMSKGLVALFLEMSTAARELGLLDELLEGYASYYPGVMTALDRLVPTYPQHAARRAEELGELESTLRRLGHEPNMVRGARATIAAVSELDLVAHRANGDGKAWTIAEVVDTIHSLA